MPESALDNRPEMRSRMTPAELGEIVRRCGFRAELLVDDSGNPVIGSATAGVAFSIRFGNRADAEGHYVDFGYVCMIQCQGPPSAEFAATWNAGRRFGRVHVHDRIVVLEMDVLVAGGVADTWLAATLEIWDRLLQDLLVALDVRRAAASSTTSAQEASA